MLKDDVVVMKKNCLEDDIEKVKVILGKDEKSIFRLNETAKFIWDNCQLSTGNSMFYRKISG